MPGRSSFDEEEGDVASVPVSGFEAGSGGFGAAGVRFGCAFMRERLCGCGCWLRGTIFCSSSVGVNAVAGTGARADANRSIIADTAAAGAAVLHCNDFPPTPLR